MDLLVVCADSGLSMEAALERVGRELGDTYPSLSANIHMTNLEIRAGRTHDRGARAFRRPARPRGGALVRHPDPAIGRARLQHHRRAARLQRRHAPQAALARRGEGLRLPAKLSVPMMVCIFPVLFVVILLPVIVRLYTHHY